jgi:hypothetical protein
MNRRPFLAALGFGLAAKAKPAIRFRNGSSIALPTATQAAIMSSPVREVMWGGGRGSGASWGVPRITRMVNARLTPRGVERIDPRQPWSFDCGWFEL